MDAYWGILLVSKEPEMSEFEGTSETGPALSLSMMETERSLAVTMWQGKDWNGTHRSL